MISMRCFTLDTLFTREHVSTRLSKVLSSCKLYMECILYSQKKTAMENVYHYCLAQVSINCTSLSF